MLTPYDRYMNDPTFRKLVDILLHFMLSQEGSITPTEVREASLIATIKYEERRLRYVPLPDANKEEVIKWLHGEKRDATDT
jgi:hypothetical protein